MRIKIIRSFKCLAYVKFRFVCCPLIVILPQDNAVKFKFHENKNAEIFQDCINSIDHADIMVALLEGADADSGTSVELGYAYSKGLISVFQKKGD